MHRACARFGLDFALLLLLFALGTRSSSRRSRRSRSRSGSACARRIACRQVAGGYRMRRGRLGDRLALHGARATWQLVDLGALRRSAGERIVADVRCAGWRIVLLAAGASSIAGRKEERCCTKKAHDGRSTSTTRAYALGCCIQPLDPMIEIHTRASGRSNDSKVIGIVEAWPRTASSGQGVVLPEQVQEGVAR